MKTYRYSLSKLVVALAVGIAFLVMGHWMTETFVRKGWFAGWIFMALAVFVIIFVTRYLVTSRAVLRLEPGRITYMNMLGSHRARPEDFRSARILEHRTAVSSARQLKLDFGQGIFGACNISEKFLEKEAGKLEAIVRDLEAFVETGALGSSAIRRTARVPQPVVAEQQSPSVASFGRKGL